MDSDLLAAPDSAARARGIRADDREIAPWRTFLHAHARVTRRLDDELRREHGISLAEYDALLQLATTPGRRLRMNQLAERVLLSRSGVTRLIDRLVEDGSVERSSCLADARGAEAVLTRSGLERLRQASATHLRGIRRWFVGQITEGDREAIERGLGRVVTALGPASRPAADQADDA